MGLNTGHSLYSYIKFYGEGAFPEDVSTTYGARNSGTPTTTSGTYGTAVTSQVTFANSASQTDVSRTVFIWAKQQSLGSLFISAGSGGVSGWGVGYNATQQIEWTDFGVAGLTTGWDPWGTWGGGTWGAFAVRRDRTGTNDVRFYTSYGLVSSLGGSSYNTGTYSPIIAASNGIARAIIIEYLVSESDIISILTDPTQLLASGSSTPKRNLLLRVG